MVIEDTITTGGSAQQGNRRGSCGRWRGVGVLALVDREEGGRETLEGDGKTGRVAARASEIVPLIPGRV